jgi:hypothetical protein
MNRAKLSTMKAKRADRSFPVASIRAARWKVVSRPADASEPISRPRPFLVHALPLRSRKPFQEKCD